ncbi:MULTISPECIES: DoxX family membrane protein [Mycetohabitans]|nr:MULTISPECIES: DoxX family membrane protein [Mycetohabitans]MCF7695826.1 DoxX family membrane protein [Mycetohabitans sp. B2]MCG1047160.1 DoxX family membrane protein [Mycetohabitans sp. B6]
MEHAPDSVRQRATRTIALRTHGQPHGPLTRRVSPAGIGELIKSFVFLDDFDITPFGYTSFRVHSHSGIATITVLLNGDLRYAGTTGGLPTPILGYIGSMTLELAASVLLTVGYHRRFIAALRAVYSIVTALIFHHALSDQNPMFHFLKNVAMSAEFFQGRAFGAGAYSFDNREKASDVAIALAQ